ncbi:hypothetical protein MNBD_GAMMA12-1242 [hydrothermal vent metagenome]|uniref:Uncharacterized protein n=1 Tax=hydrothermal vent metagenome TaxID=652676 RepID=A0A3B0Y6V0_9ZZZZ
MKFKIIYEKPLLSSCSYLCDVNTTKDGIKLMLMIYDLLSDGEMQFEVSIDGDSENNGWSLGKTNDGYLFHLMCERSGNGFEVGYGNIYSYKVGNDTTMLEWPYVEFGEIPKNCFISKEKAHSLLLELYKSDANEEDFVFEYSDEHWQLVSWAE